MEEQDRFEQFLSKELPSVDQTPHQGGYKAPITDMLWLVWRAARAAAFNNAKDAGRYERLRDWFVRGGVRGEIDPNEHVRKTTPDLVDAALDALETKR